MHALEEITETLQIRSLRFLEAVLKVGCVWQSLWQNYIEPRGVAFFILLVWRSENSVNSA